MKTSKDFTIFKIRYYADEKLLKKYRLSPNGPLPEQHYERAKLHIEFFWKLVELVTKKSDDIWYSEYMFGARDCAKEELSDYDIFIDEGEGWYTYLIPVERKDISDWIYDNANTPMKIIRKYNMYSPNFLGHRTWLRDDCKKYMEKNSLTPQIASK